MLTVHHLDMNPANCDPSNLVALCQSCHLSIQSRVDWLQSYMFDMPDWMEWRHEQVRHSVQSYLPDRGRCQMYVEVTNEPD